MAKSEKGTRERKTYSVYRLETAPAKSDPNSPDTKWVALAYFESENDAITAARLVKEANPEDDKHYGIVREIRQKEATPKVTRRVV